MAPDPRDGRWLSLVRTAGDRLLSADQSPQQAEADQNDQRREIESGRSHTNWRNHSPQGNEHRIGEARQNRANSADRVIGRDLKEAENDPPEEDENV